MKGAPLPDLIRAPNHLGDLVMALPALASAPDADVLVVRALAPLVELALPGRRVIPFDRGRAGLVRVVRALRKARYCRGVLLAPSFSSALHLVLGGVAERRGSATDGRRALLTDPVEPAAFAGLHRAGAYHFLVTGEWPSATPIPRIRIPEALRERWRAQVPQRPGTPVIGIFPGGNASSRRWDADRFAAVAAELAAAGAGVVVFGGPSERELGARVAGEVAIDVSGRTDLGLLAAGLASLDLLVTNDSGPLHLAAAVGTPAVALYGAGDPRVTGPLGSGHIVLQRSELPCVPCVRNECPRRGRGTWLPEAERECLRLIEVADVLAAVGSSEERISRGRAE